MDKILSINTIKNVFAALGAKTSDDNYAVGLFDKTTAEPKGIMGISDFASVMGGIGYSRTIPSNDIANISQAGTYYVDPYTQNRPNGTYYGGILCFKVATTYLMIFVTTDGSSMFFATLRPDTTFSSSSWHSV